MVSNEVKFEFDYELLDREELDIIFNNIDEFLNLRLDRNLKFYAQRNEGEIYAFKDLSDENYDFVEYEKNRFYKFKFDNVVDVPLYKFLVLKHDGKLTVLANIHHSIFDYTSINFFYDVFNQSRAQENFNVRESIDQFIENFESYLGSQEYVEDQRYWEDRIFDVEDFARYYNVKSSNYRTMNFSIKNDFLESFLKNYRFSKFQFFIAIFSLYLSRIDATRGCLIKTSLFNNENHFSLDAKNTLLIIDYLKNDTFKEYSNRIEKVYSDASNHTKVRIENYIDQSFYYSIHDFTNLNDIIVKDGDGSALTFNIYDDSIDIIYNCEFFSDIYIDYMAKNIQFLVSNVLDGIDQRCGDLKVIQTGVKYDFDSVVPLNSSQKAILVNIMDGYTGSKYNNSAKINLRGYSANKVKRALNKLFKSYPILCSRVLEEDILLGFDAKPPIQLGSMEDIESFVQPFPIFSYLSRFLIVEDGRDLFLCMDFHTLIFDLNSFNFVINALLLILDGDSSEFVEHGPLRQISFLEVMDDPKYNEKARTFFDGLLADRDEVNDLVFSVAEESSKVYHEVFEIDEKKLTLPIPYPDLPDILKYCLIWFLMLGIIWVCLIPLVVF